MQNPIYSHKETQTQNQTHIGHNIFQDGVSETDLFPHSST